MPTVDDLIVSVRIDETSNLGKLQKQLTALVGPKGDKKIDLGAGIDPNIKRDITFIKDRMLYLVPLIMSMDPIKIRETSMTILKQLIEIPGLMSQLEAKFAKSPEKMRMMLDYLFKIGDSQVAVTNRVAGTVSDIHSIVFESERLGGKVVTAINRIMDSIPEVSYKVAEISRALTALEIRHDLEHQLYELDSSKTEKYRYQIQEAIKSEVKSLKDLHKISVKQEEMENAKASLEKIDDAQKAVVMMLKELGLSEPATEKILKDTLEHPLLRLVALLQAEVSAAGKKLVKSPEFIYKTLDIFRPKIPALGVPGPRRVDITLRNIKEMFEKGVWRKQDVILGQIDKMVDYVHGLVYNIEYKGAAKKGIAKYIEDRFEELETKKLVLWVDRINKQGKKELIDLERKLYSKDKDRDRVDWREFVVIQRDVEGVKDIAGLSTDYSRDNADVMNVINSTLLNFNNTILNVLGDFKKSVEKYASKDDIKGLEAGIKTVEGLLTKTDPTVEKLDED